MFINYLKIAFRNILKNKVYSFINITGLAVGLTCCIVIVLYVRNQLGYDGFNVHADRIYRPVAYIVYGGHALNLATCPAPMGAAMKRDFPEVVAYTRIRNFGTPILKYGDKAFNEPRFLCVDSTFFDIFTVHFLKGDPRTALTQPNSVVITESIARKYFGDIDPMGKILNANHSTNWIVTGVIKDWPKDSHFKFDFLGSLCSYNDSQNQFWLSNNYYTYLLLRKGASAAVLQKKINKELMDKYVGPQLKASVGMSASQFFGTNGKYEYSLEPLTSIHLYSHLDVEIEPNGDISYVYIFSAIAIAILLIACVNFINLATARSEKRSKEVGVRKTLGSNRPQLVRQFLTESVMMSLLAVTLAIGLVEIFLPLFNSVSGEELNFKVSGGPLATLLLLGLGVFIGLIAGSYPAFYLSSFNPTVVLKRDIRRSGRRALLRGGLVVFQFVVSIILFVGTFVIYNQLKYIQNKNLGFDKEQVIVIKWAGDLGDRINQFKQELISDPQIVSVSASSAVPGNQQDDSAYWLEGTSPQDSRDMRQMWCDYDFLKTYGITLERGRFFSPDHPSDSSAVVVNQVAESALSTKSLVGNNLVTPGRMHSQKQILPVIGVVKNFNFQSLHQVIRPLVIGLLPAGYTGSFVSVRVKPGDYTRTISFIRSAWKKYASGGTLDYNFLNQDLQHLYLADLRASSIALIFSILAIFVACLGLLGLAAFVAERRTKEIGIRKVLGASVPEMIALLSVQFAKWVLIANIIAWPLAYLIMDKWLQNFAYRTNISIWIFIASGAVALLIALLTVSSQAIKAATANPVKSLRYE